MNARAVYATIQGKTEPVRVGAQLCTEPAGMVSLWLVNGGSLGLFKLERFEGSRVTESTLRQLLEAPAS